MDFGRRVVVEEEEVLDARAQVKLQPLGEVAVLHGQSLLR